ncbi:hypothetical protein WA538_002673 [Blastocystis sp. DL]
MTQRGVMRHVRQSLGSLATSPQVIRMHLTVVAGKAMLELVTKRLNEMVAENDIGEGMKGKYLQVSKAEVTNVFLQEKGDVWSCYDGRKDGEETDVDCGGGCENGCTLLKSCQEESDCVSGLFCTKKKCVDRNWKQVIVTSITIVSLIVVVVVVIIIGGVVYQKVVSLILFLFR